MKNAQTTTTPEYKTLPDVYRQIVAARIPLRYETIRAALEAGKVRGARIGSRWYTTVDAVCDAMVHEVGPKAKR